MNLIDFLNSDFVTWVVLGLGFFLLSLELRNIRKELELQTYLFAKSNKEDEERNKRS